LIDIKSSKPRETSGLQSSLSAKSAASVYINYLEQAGLDPREEATFLRDPQVKNKVMEIIDQRMVKIPQIFTDIRNVGYYLKKLAEIAN
jgi:ABC-type metal ion transport system substrate-binding protein